MSVSIFYFEQNKPSEYFSGYAQVNHYSLPVDFEGHFINVVFENNEVQASEFGYGVASACYRLNENLLNQLSSFIGARLQNPCVQPILYVFIENNGVNVDELLVIDTDKKIRIKSADLKIIFKQKIFQGLFYFER